jgi:hypothetical protein
VSNAVSALRPPEGRNARQILAMQGSIVAVLIAGISWLAHATHATPYTAGFPTVLAQEAALVFGSTPAGQIMFYTLQRPPPRSCSPVATPASPGSRSWPVSWPRTPSCPAG